MKHLRDEELCDALAAEHAAVCPACAARVEVQQSVRALVGALDSEAPVGRETREVVAGQRARARSRRPTPEQRSYWLPVTGLLVALGGGVTAYALWPHRGHPPGSGRGAPPFPDPLCVELVLDHQHYEHRADMGDVRGDAAATAAWLTDHLGIAPRLAEIEGTTFEGGKASRIGGKPGALVWMTRSSHWVSLFLLPQQELAHLSCVTTQQDLGLCAGPEAGGGARAVVGDLPVPELERILIESGR